MVDNTPRFEPCACVGTLKENEKVSDAVFHERPRARCGASTDIGFSPQRSLTPSGNVLASRPEFKNKYNEFLDEYERLGHMRIVSDRDTQTKPASFVLPHHGVLRESKIRVVFNGSHRSSSGTSLNDCLHIGPKLQVDLSDVILRWRRFQFAFAADVEKMYRQIRVHEDDQTFQRIVWRSEPSHPVQEFALTTVTYGLACAPFLALRCMQQLAIDEGDNFPRAKDILLRETYVDDVLSGADCAHSAQEKIQQLKRLLGAGGFALKKWVANCAELLPAEERRPESCGEKPMSVDAPHRALSLSWNTASDTFSFSFKVPTHAHGSKRGVLSTISQLFDPLGWLAPVTELVPQAYWHHVPGTCNPADLASRGVSPQSLLDSIWWRGPAWLRDFSPAWPAETLSPDPRIDIEKRSEKLYTSHSATTQSWNLIERFSSITRLVRVTALCLRAASRLKVKRADRGPSDPLSVSEIEKTRQFWIRQTQKEHFTPELLAITHGIDMPKSSPLVHLMPFADANGILRVGGRLQHSLLDADQKHPVILPRSSKFTSLVIAKAHLHTLHAGPQLTLATIRQSYWIVGGRQPVRAFIKRCVICTRHSARQCTQLMGQLPSRRVTTARAFVNTGVDYAGPFHWRTMRGRGAKVLKGYLALFVCMATGAVHLEFASDYTADAFIAAYKRFTGRRGICRTLSSDCGTNFIGANAELRRMFTRASQEAQYIADSLANLGTQWIFNPPSAPHFGGKWEAAVKSTKFHMRRVIGESPLTFEEYATLFAQIEASLNSRPLCPLSDDPSDLAALTPGHFLIGDALNVIPEPDLTDTPRSRLSRWQLLRQLIDHFWSRWSREYMQQFLTASKWQTKSPPVRIGDLVLVRDERTPPARWPLARVTELHPGKDNITRVVTVRTATTVLKRPITKLCRLPVDATTTDS
ncbi:uncharacterized protein LOC143219688 [Lasioglossum baleicum]|uniref:uncharacterized protein LOC143219688 n=1 Tax=Lasioglossum baleicum TaxID=434251 RepID=UPI003FCCACF9